MRWPWIPHYGPFWGMSAEDRLLRVARQKGPLAKSKLVSMAAGTYRDGLGPAGLIPVIKHTPEVQQAFRRLTAAGALVGRQFEGRFTRYTCGLTSC